LKKSWPEIRLMVVNASCMTYGVVYYMQYVNYISKRVDAILQTSTSTIVITGKYFNHVYFVVFHLSKFAHLNAQWFGLGSAG